MRKMEVDLESSRVEAVHARGGRAERLGRGFAGVDVEHAVREIQPAVGADDHRVGRVMRIFGRDPLEQANLDVGLVVAVGVFEKQNFRRGRDQHAAPPEFESGDAVQAVGEHDQAIGFAVAVVVGQDDQFVLQRLLGVPVRIGGPGGGPQASVGVDRHLHRLDQIGKLLFGGEQIDLHSCGELHFADRHPRPPGRDIFRPRSGPGSLVFTSTNGGVFRSLIVRSPPSAMAQTR